MENILKHCEINKLECILGCKNSKEYYKFPHDDAILKLWLNKLSLDNIPSNNRLPRICNNHFSDDMFEADKKRLKLSAIPTLNLLDKRMESQLNESGQTKPKIVHLFKDVSKPTHKVSDCTNGETKPTKKLGGEPLPLAKQRAEIIVSKDSLCYLKCSDAKTTYQFPKDEELRKVWIEQLSMPSVRFTSARICRNHFSPRMYAHEKAIRLTRYAFPDMNLPGETIFTSVEGPLKVDYWPVGAPLRPKKQIRHLVTPNNPTVEDNNDFSDDMFVVDKRRLKSKPTLNISNTMVNKKTENQHNEVLKIVKTNPIIAFLFKDSIKPTHKVNDSTNKNTIQRKESEVEVIQVDEEPMAPEESSKTSEEMPQSPVVHRTVAEAKLQPDKNKSQPEKDKSQQASSKKITEKRNRSIRRPVFLPLTQQRAEIIVSKDSRCFLKCRDAKHTYQFPKDEGSRKIWIEQLSMPSIRFSSARICRNHFSPRMFTHKRALRLTRCAVPDINLPGETIFTSVEGPLKVDYWPVGAPLRSKKQNHDVVETNNQPDEEKMQEFFRAMLDPPFPIEDHPEMSHPEILINPIQNIKTAINQEHHKEGILHVFRPQDDAKVLLPDNADDAKEECVLKCPNPEHLYKFPNLEFNRKIWLERIGLTHCYFNTMLCEKHFSEKMFSKTKKTLLKSAYPDINLPKNNQSRLPKKLSDYRLVLPDHVCDVIELPEYICVLTVLQQHTEIEAPVNSMKYVKHNVEIDIPKREREVQVLVSDMVSNVDIGISADESMDEFDAQEDTDYVDSVKSPQTEMFECLVCGEISIGDDCHIKHSDTHKESSSLCFQCGRLFSSQIRLKVHENKRHFGSQIRKALRCPKIHCKKAFHSKKQLLNHVEEHTRRSEHKCKKCKQVFHSALKLHSHQMTCRSTWWPKYPKRVHIRTRRNC